MKAVWQTKRLGELCRIRTGKKDVNQGNPDGVYPFFTCAAEHTFSDSYSFDTEALLIAGNGNVGQVSYYKGKFEAYQRTYVISDFSDVQSRYLFLILDGKLKETVSKQKLGNTMPYIKVGMLTEFLVPIPPLSEQNRIVAILDEAFEGIARAKVNAEKNMQNARELFDMHHQTVFEAAGDDAIFKSLGDFANFRNGINYTKQSRGRTVPIIGVKDFQNHFWAPIDELDSVTLNGELSSADKVAEGDILTVRSNGNPELIGRSMVVGELTEPVTHSGFTIRIRIDRTASLPTYVCQFMRSRAVRRELIDNGNGLNIKSLNQGMLSEIVVPLPPLSKQHEVVGKIESMALETARLANIVSRKLAALDELKKSLLHQAFSGAL